MAEGAGDTVTLLFSDIEGSTRLLQRTGDAYAGLLSPLVCAVIMPVSSITVVVCTSLSLSPRSALWRS